MALSSIEELYTKLHADFINRGSEIFRLEKKLLKLRQIQEFLVGKLYQHNIQLSPDEWTIIEEE